MINSKQFYATGKRKTASARVFMTKPELGKAGDKTVNNLPFEQYFPGKFAQITVFRPFQVIQLDRELFNFYITVRGGGKSAQQDAIKYGIAKALVAYEKTLQPQPVTEQVTAEGEEADITLSFHKQLKDAGYLTRDARKVERKKVGHLKARKSPPYKKR